MTPLINTPVEEHNGILVKQEGDCAPTGWPRFSKIRGVVAHLENRPEQIIGVLDTYHSKAGWAVAAACAELGKECVNYYPVRKVERNKPIKPQQIKSRDFGASLEALPAGRSAILYHQAKKDLKANALDTYYMMPNALKLDESVSETAKEVMRTDLKGVDTVAISISSGTIGAGVIKGLHDVGFNGDILLHLGYSRSESAVYKYVREKSGVLSASPILIDEHYQYSDAVDYPVGFECNRYYDLKLWKFLNTNPFYGKVLMWNVGA